MATLPQLNEEDTDQIRSALADFLAKSEASTTLVTAEGGFLIFEEGITEDFDTTTLAALASNAFLANKAIAEIIAEPNFNCLYQQGEKFSLFVRNIDIYHCLIVLFPTNISVGAVKYYAEFAIQTIAQQLQQAAIRSPSEAIDPAMLNLTNTVELFKRKSC
jgi:predicted regulator of Ras-like GTPase activity (Roadblock/LC7/MglB family)